MGCRWDEDPHTGGAWLTAIQAALGVVYSESLVLSLALQPGDMLLIDASRVLFGKAPLGPGASAGYDGGFISRDEALNRARLLRRVLPR